MSRDRLPLMAKPEDANDLEGLWRVHAPPTEAGYQVVAASYCTRDHALLFAAGPELLAAARQAMDECCDLIETDAGHALEAAIAKAEGRVP